MSALDKELLRAAAAGDAMAINECLDGGASPRATDHFGCNALQVAASRKQPAAIATLIERGFDPNDHVGGTKAPLWRSISKNPIDTGRVDAAEILIVAGARLDVRDDSGRTLLHEAACGNHPQAVELLLHHGLDPNARDKDDRTPLHEAVKARDPRVAWLLHQAGADLEAQDQHGCRPIHHAAVAGFSPLDKRHDFVTVLQALGASTRGVLVENAQINKLLRRSPMEAALALGHPGILLYALDLHGHREVEQLESLVAQSKMARQMPDVVAVIRSWKARQCADSALQASTSEVLQPPGVR